MWEPKQHKGIFCAPRKCEALTHPLTVLQFLEMTPADPSHLASNALDALEAPDATHYHDWLHFKWQLTAFSHLQDVFDLRISCNSHSYHSLALYFQKGQVPAWNTITKNAMPTCRFAKPIRFRINTHVNGLSQSAPFGLVRPYDSCAQELRHVKRHLVRRVCQDSQHSIRALGQTHASGNFRCVIRPIASGIRRTAVACNSPISNRPPRPAPRLAHR